MELRIAQKSNMQVQVNFMGLVGAFIKEMTMHNIMMTKRVMMVLFRHRTTIALSTNFLREMGKRWRNENVVCLIELELKSEEDYGRKEESIESYEVHTGGSSGSSSSSSSINIRCISSDEESNVEKETEVIETRQPVDSSSKAASQVVTSMPAGKNSNAVAVTVEVTPGQIQENSNGGLPSSVDNTVILSVLIDLGSSKKEDKTVSISEANPTQDSATEVKDDKLLLSFNAPSVHTSNGVDHVKESESPECSDSQIMILGKRLSRVVVESLTSLQALTSDFSELTDTVVEAHLRTNQSPPPIPSINNFGEFDMWLAAEHGMFLRSTQGEWMTTMPENLHMDWVDSVKDGDIYTFFEPELPAPTPSHQESIHPVLSMG
ncbi:hypothetical protein AgCh_020465 [Apium graveolens]